MDWVAIKDLVADIRSNFATLFANHSQAMAKLFDAVEAKEAKLFDAMEVKEAKLFAAMEAKDVAHQSQIQASFNKFHKLEKPFRSVPNAVTAHLDTTIPQVMASVVDRTLPTTVVAVLRDTISPILKTVMDDTITDSLLSVLEGSFMDFTTKFSSISMDMAQTVRNLLASAKAPLLEHYSAVQEDYSACKAQLEEVVTLLLTREGLPSSAPASPSRAPPVDHGGDAPDCPHSADADSTYDEA